MSNKGAMIGTSWIVLIAASILGILTFLFAPVYIAIIMFIVLFLPIILFILINAWVKRWVVSTVFTFSVWLNIVILIIPLFVGLAAMDISKFAESLSEDPKYLALRDDQIFFAVKIDSASFGLEDIVLGNSFKVLPENELEDLKKEIKSGVENKVVFVLEKEFFRNTIGVDLEEYNIRLTKDQVFAVLKSEQAESTLLESGVDSRILSAVDESELKILTLALLMQDTLDRNGPEFFLQELKNSNIKIYPRRFSIELLIKILPENIISQSGLLPDLPSGQTAIAAETVNGR